MMPRDVYDDKNVVWGAGNSSKKSPQSDPPPPPGMAAVKLIRGFSTESNRGVEHEYKGLKIINRRSHYSFFYHLGECLHTEFFSKVYYINPKPYCIYHAPIDLEQQTDIVRLVSNQSVTGKYNQVSSISLKF